MALALARGANDGGISFLGPGIASDPAVVADALVIADRATRHTGTARGVRPGWDAPHRPWVTRFLVHFSQVRSEGEQFGDQPNGLRDLDVVVRGGSEMGTGRRHHGRRAETLDQQPDVLGRIGLVDRVVHRLQDPEVAGGATDPLPVEAPSKNGASSL